MKRSGSILEREYDEYDYDLPPPSNQEHGEAQAELLAREKAAGEAAEAERRASELAAIEAAQAKLLADELAAAEAARALEVPTTRRLRNREVVPNYRDVLPASDDEQNAAADEESNGHASGDHTDNEYEDTDQQLLDEDDEFVPDDEQMEAEEIDRLLGNPVEPETPETPETPELDEATRLHRKQRNFETRRRRANIANYTAINLGIDVLDPDRIGPFDSDAHRHIAFFKEDFCETVSVRVAQALSFKTFPLPKESQFNTQSLIRLKQLGVDGIWRIIDTRMTKRVKEVLGRRKFGRQEVLDLPKLTVEDQHRRGCYLDHVQHPTKGDKLYTGSATGENGLAGRWITYNDFKVGAQPNAPERTRLHLSAGLEPLATMHLRHLVFLDDIDSSVILLIEALLMDFLGTIDRTPRHIGASRSNGRTIVLQSPEILETSKQAFPRQRQPMEFEGLNSVSSLKQMGGCKLPHGRCPLDSWSCKENPRLVVADGDPKVICLNCAELWNRWLRKGTAVNDSTGDWDEFVAKRKAAKAPLVQSAEIIAAQPLYPYVCSDCGRDYKSQSELDKHSCRMCKHCKHVFANNTSLPTVAAHVAKCEGVFKGTRVKQTVNHYSCPLCSGDFKSAQWLRKHENEGRCLAVEANREPDMIDCSTCWKQYVNKRGLQQHHRLLLCTGVRAPGAMPV
jgi:hypothetical protein